MTTGVESLRAWEAIRGAMKKERGAILAGLPNARGSLQEATARVLAWVDSLDAPPRDAELQGALSALSLGRLRDDLTPAWLSLGGPSFAIACAAHERKAVAAHPRRAGTLDLGTRWLEPRTAEQTDITLDALTWETLSKAFRGQKKDERVAARSEVREARQGAHPALAVWIDAIAQLPEEAVEDLAFAGALPEPAWRALEPWLTELVPSLALLPRDRAKPAALALIERASTSALGKLAAHAKSLVEIVGPSGAPALMRLLSDAHKSPFPDVTSAKKLANALATLDDPSVLAFFERHLSSRLLGVVAAEIVAKKSADTEKKALAVDLHEGTVAAKVIRATRAKKVAKARAVVQKSEQAVAQAATASPEQLPWILREPPWRTPSIPPLPEASVWIDVPFEEKLHLLASDSEGLENEDVADDPIGLLATRGLSAVSLLLEWPANLSAPALRRVESPRVAARLLEVLPSRRRLVEGYFTQYPVASALALLPLALARSSSAPTSIRPALEALSGMWSSGCELAIRSAALSLGQGDVVDRLGRACRLLDGPSASPHLPAWCIEARGPTVLLAGGERLPPEAIRAVVELMTSIEIDKPSEGVSEIRSACDKTSLDAFLCALLAAWSRAKAWDDAWVLPSIAALGGSDSVRQIVALIREWAKERTTWPHALDAVSALEAAGVGATAALSGLVRKGSRTIAERAELVLRSIAKREGLTADELADLGTPTLDLDAHGKARLDFGARSFVVEVGDDLAPVVLDGNRRRVPTLRALKSDDPTLAAASLARMRSLKKGLGEVARSAASRLERAMVEGRVFRVSHFEEVVLVHPILGRLARRLVWQRRPLARENLAASSPLLFRVAEDGAPANLSDQSVSLGRHDEVRLAHPLEMEPGAAQSWLDLLTDYEIIQPFPQMARPVFAPLPGEIDERAITRYRGRPVLQMAIQGRLLARGWERADEGSQTTALVRRARRHVAHYALVDPIVFGEPFKSETTLGVVTFGVPLSEVPPIVFSEVAYDLDVLGEGEGQGNG